MMIDTFVRINAMSPYGLTMERMDRLEDGQWVVTCERRVGDYPNTRHIRTKHLCLESAISMAHEIFTKSQEDQK